MKKSKQGSALRELIGEKANYKTLNSRQQESFNFQKICGHLADYGFETILLSNDWKGADFLAAPFDEKKKTIKVQLKGRLTFDKKYLRKGLWVCFHQGGKWYFYPHDKFLDSVDSVLNIRRTPSWKDKGRYSFSSLSKELTNLLEPYIISVDSSSNREEMQAITRAKRQVKRGQTVSLSEFKKKLYGHRLTL